MKIIVTGGAGFIGSHVTDAYIKAGHKVSVIDKSPAGSPAMANSKAKFYKADIRNADALRRIFQKEKPQAVNHHAAFISVTDSIKKPGETFEANVMGTLNVLLAFAESSQGGGKKFIFSSTGGAIYGSPRKLPAREITPPHPLSPYALSKYLDEQIISYFCGANGITYLVLRYSNVYGPRQRSSGGAGIFPAFIGKIKNGEAPVIFGNGKKTRDYVYAGDVARANLLGLSRGKNSVINISSGIETSDYEVFSAIAEAAGFSGKPKYAPKREGEVERISMSFAKAKRILGWQPKTYFKEGVRETVNFFL